MGGTLAAGPLALWAGEPSGAAGAELLPKRRFIIGHRGACAYAPENTLPSYRLAIQQGVEYVEQDLQITRDGVLVTIPTWSEAIEEIKGHAGLCPETKGPEYYGKLGFNMEGMVADVLRKHGLEKAGAGASTPVFIQSFSKTGLKRLASDYHIKWPLLWLTFVNTKWTAAMFHEASQFAAAIGPYKRDIDQQLVEQARARGLRVVSYTFRAGDEKEFKDVGAEMDHYVYSLGVDGLFTDNPDRFSRRKST